MPINGEGIYSLPAGYDAEPDETIASSVWNANFEDIEQAMNAIRPIAAGGTGFDNLQELLDELATLDLADLIAQIALDDISAIGTKLAGSGTALATTTGTQTLTNKRVTKRGTPAASTSSLTIDSDANDYAELTALAADLTINAPTGTPTNKQVLVLDIKDNGTSRALTWNAAFVGLGIALPSATTISKRLMMLFQYSTAATKWHLLSANQET